MQRPIHSYSCVIREADLPKIRHHLESRGFAFKDLDYGFFQARHKDRKVTVNVYHSLKCLVQGKGTGEFVRYFLEPEILKTFELDYGHLAFEPKIGVDESGKGDFFGPLVVSAAYVTREDLDAFASLGVMDSKRIGDSRIHPIAEQIEKRCPSRTVCIGPKKYNQLYSRFRNLNTLLAWAHCACIRGLSETCSAKRVLVDRFATTGQLERFVAKECPGIRLEQKVRGEADPAVAAASILARSVFLRELKRLSRSCGQDLPKGAGNPVLESAVQFAGAFGIDGLGNVAKMHFKTAEVVKDRFEKGKNGFSERGEANGR